MVTEAEVNAVMEHLSETVATGADIPAWLERSNIDEDTFSALIQSIATVAAGDILGSGEPLLAVGACAAQSIMVGFELAKRVVPDAELPDPNNVKED